MECDLTCGIGLIIPPGSIFHRAAFLPREVRLARGICPFYSNGQANYFTWGLACGVRSLLACGMPLAREACPCFTGPWPVKSFLYFTGLFQQAYSTGPAFKISGLDFDRFAAEPIVWNQEPLSESLSHSTAHATRHISCVRSGNDLTLTHADTD